MPTIFAIIRSVLLETDVPDLLVARDVVGTNYLCSLTARSERGDHFLALPISANKLGDLRSGVLDLRTALLHSETGFHYEGWFVRVNGEPSVELAQLANEIPAEWLPDDGFLLSDFIGHTEDAEVVREAAANHSAVLIAAFDPPDARQGVAKMNADDLATGITWFQSLVKYAHRRRLADLPDKIRRAFQPDAYVLQATAFSPGSFRVHFESKYHADWWGTSDVGLAMSKVDELMGLAMLPADQQLEVLRNNKGHAIAALRNLLKFIAEEGSGLNYKWADPVMRAASERTVTPAAAAALCTVLDHREELTAEELKFTGEFIRVAEDRKTWRVHDIDAQTYRTGKLHPEVPDLLRGIVIADKRYRFVIDEKIEMTATGKTVPKLLMRHLEEIE